jgi:hypothetical protein
MYTPPATVNGTGPRGNLIFNADKMAPVKPGAESPFSQDFELTLRPDWEPLLFWNTCAKRTTAAQEATVARRGLRSAALNR